MPKELTHWLMADRIFRGLPDDSRLRGVIGNNLSGYLAGAVLPDTLLHLHNGPYSATALALAHAFHDAAGNSFAPLIQAEVAHPEGLQPAMLACLLGVITHIEADIVFHPLVHALAGSGQIGQHYQVETDMDVSYLSAGILPANTHLADLVTPDIHDTIVSSCGLLFDPDGILPREALEQALRQHCRIQAMYDSTFWKLAARFLAIVKGSPYNRLQHLFYPLLRPTDSVFTVDGVNEWRNPVTLEVQRSSLEDLAAVVVQRTIDLFGLIESGGSLAAALAACPAENMLTGIHGMTHDAPVPNG